MTDYDRPIPNLMIFLGFLLILVALGGFGIGFLDTGEGTVIPSPQPLTTQPLTTQSPPPTATPEVCFGFDGVEGLVTQYPCLDGPNTHDTESGIYQAVPRDRYLVQTLENRDGLVDYGSQAAPIYCDPAHCQLLVHNRVIGINGSWGLGEELELDGGCHIIKATGHGWINDPPRDFPAQTDYLIIFWVEGESIGTSSLPLQGPYEEVAAFWISEPGTYSYEVTYSVAWSSAGAGSWIEIFGLGVIEVPDEWCPPPPTF